MMPHCSASLLFLTDTELFRTTRDGGCVFRTSEQVEQVLDKARACNRGVEQEHVQFSQEK